MSFFRSIRSSISRGKSSSRDSTPVRSSRPGSVVGSDAAGRRDSMDSRADSLFNRSDTFILGSSDLDEESRRSRSNSNASTLEKKSKKSKVLSKFSTFTKRKKTPPAPGEDAGACEHHPSDDATNTYYKWKAEGGGTSTLDYDAHSDPFNFLYEQQSSRRSLQNGITGAGGGSGSGSSANTEMPLRAELRSSAVGQLGQLGQVGTSGGNHETSKYRKSRLPTPTATTSSTMSCSPLKEQLEQLKSHTNTTATLNEEEPEAELDGDKFKTITLNSFRKSFRDKLLKLQTEAPHNPAWFVEVDPPAVDAAAQQERARLESKENRPDFLVFENDNYRPQSRSPVRDRERDRDQQSSRSSRSNTRSPVKRNETFRVERPSMEPARHAAAHTTAASTAAPPSIRIEIKNSITPNLPGRMVPVGVAKPMPSPYISDYYHHHHHHQQQQHQQQQHQQQQQQQRATAAPPTYHHHHHYHPHQHISQPQRNNWSKASPAVSPVRNASTVNRSGRYQTLVQIRNESAAKSMQASPLAAPTSRHATRIQLSGGGSPPAPQKRLLNSAGSRYSIATASLTMPTHGSGGGGGGGGGGLSSCELLRNGSCGVKAAAPTQASLAKTHSKPRHTTYFGDAQVQPAASAATAPASRTFPATSVYVGSRTTAGGKLHHHQHYQARAAPVPVQRRSRSPIKMPWR